MTFAIDGRLDDDIAAQLRQAGITYGLSLGRRAPIHKMHVDCILEIAAAGLTPVVVIGSVNPAGDPLYDPLRNPLTFETQYAQLEKALPPEIFARCKILTLPDELEDEVWLARLQEMLTEHDMAGRTVMHFRAKAADALSPHAARCRPLSTYRQKLLSIGLAVWQSYNADPADDHINASDLRTLDLSRLDADALAASPALEFLADEALRLRACNPDGQELDAAGIPVSMLDFTLDRLHREAGMGTGALLKAAAELSSHVSLDTLMAATKAHIEELKRRPLIVNLDGGGCVSGPFFDPLAVKTGVYQSGEGFCDLGNGSEDAQRIKGAHVYVHGSTAQPVAKNVQELLQVVHTLKMHGAAKVTVVMPFAAYARQDRSFCGRLSSVSADLLPRQLKAAGADAVMTVGVHSKAAVAFYKAAFGVEFTHVSSAEVLAQHLSRIGITADTAVIGAPDGGDKPDDEGVARAVQLGKALSPVFNAASMFSISKVHTAHSDSKVTSFQGAVAGKTAVVVDDMIDGGSTLINAARTLKVNGAAQVICCATHGILTAGERPALERLLTAQENGVYVIDRLVITDSVPDVATKIAALPQHLAARVDLVPLAPVLGEEMKRHHCARLVPNR